MSMMNRTQCGGPGTRVASPGAAEESVRMAFKDNCDFSVCIVEAVEGLRKDR